MYLCFIDPVVPLYILGQAGRGLPSCSAAVLPIWSVRFFSCPSKRNWEK